jgi:YaiO family outer membrane protein
MRRLLAAPLVWLVLTAAAVGQDADLLYRQGREARLAGRFAEAAEKLREAARLQPDNADVQVELGLALTTTRQFVDADKALRQALRLAPDYVDAKLGLARLAFFAKRYEEARTGTKAVLARRPDDKDAKALLQQIERAISDQAAEQARRRAAVEARRIAAAAPPAERPPLHLWRFDADGSLSKLTGGREDWREFSGRLGYRIWPGTTVSGGLEVARRSEATDAYFEGRVDHKLTPDISIHLVGGGTPEAHFRPLYVVGAGVAARLYQQRGFVAATVLTAEGKYSEYVLGPVRTVSPGIEQYLLDGRVWITAKWIQTRDERGRDLGGYLVRGDVLVRDDLRLFAGYADAPESSEGFTMETRSVFGGVSYDFTRDITLRVSAAYEQRPGFFDRRTVSIGATTRF